MAIVGPTAENAALEGSKVHSKRFMERIGVPTARFAAGIQHMRPKLATALRQFRLPVVLKTDGLAAGKGVVIAPNQRKRPPRRSVPQPALSDVDLRVPRRRGGQFHCSVRG